MHRLQDLVRLHREGEGYRRIAQLLSISPTTERHYRRIMEQEGLLEGDPKDLPDLERLKTAVLKHQPRPPPSPHEESSIVEWTETIQAYLAKGLGPKAIYDRLKLETQSEFQGSYDAVKRLCRRLKRVEGVAAKDVVIPVVTAPAEVAQVDFGYVGKLYDREQKVLRRAWCFVMVLGFSRHMYVEVVFDQKTETWVGLHQRAFQALGGVVRTVVPDNLKAAVLRRAFGTEGDTALNRSYRELARHYGFKIDPTPPYAPKKKGKVEASVKYVKHNALQGRDGEDLQDVNAFLLRWVDEVAGQRTHGTTGKQPLMVFRDLEQPELLSLPEKRYEEVFWKKAKVQPNAHVEYGGRFYSVPWKGNIGKSAWIQATSSSVIIHIDDVRCATHRRHGRGQWSTVESHLPEHRRDLRYRSQSYWQARADRLGPHTGALVREIFASDEVLSQLRSVQAIVQYLEQHPVQRAENTSERALYFGNRHYADIKRILVKGLDMEPLPHVVINPVGPKSSPRFARSTEEILRCAREGDHEPH